jgi:hypothetical protein
MTSSKAEFINNIIIKLIERKILTEQLHTNIYLNLRNNRFKTVTKNSTINRDTIELTFQRIIPLN